MYPHKVIDYCCLGLNNIFIGKKILTVYFHHVYPCLQSLPYPPTPLPAQYYIIFICVLLKQTKSKQTNKQINKERNTCTHNSTKQKPK